MNTRMSQLFHSGNIVVVQDFTGYLNGIVKYIGIIPPGFPGEMIQSNQSGSTVDVLVLFF